MPGLPVCLSVCASMMDANLSAMMLADAQAIAAEAGQTVTINAVTYPAMVTDATLTQGYEAGGLMDKIETVVKIPATSAVLAAASSMTLGKKVTWDGRIYRITGKTRKPGGCWVQLNCQDADQR